MALSPDGRMLALAGDTTVSLWNTRSHRLLTVLFNAHRHRYRSSSSLTDVTFSPDGTLLAASTPTGGVQLWDVSRQRAIGKPLVRRGVHAFEFSGDGKVLVTSQERGMLQFWELSSRTIALERRVGFAEQLAVAPNGDTLAIPTGVGVQLWSIRRQAQLGPPLLLGRDASTLSVGFSPDGGRLLVGSQDGSVALWDLDGIHGITHAVGKRTRGWISSLALNPDGTRIAFHESPPFRPNTFDFFWLREPGTLRVLDVDTGHELAALELDATALAFTFDGDRLVAAQDEQLVIVDPGAGSETGTIPVSRPPLSLAASPTENIVATVTDGDPWVTLWDPIALTEIRRLRYPDADFFDSVTFDPSGTTVAAGGASGDIVVWDVATGRRLFVLQPKMTDIFGLAFSPEGKSIAAAGYSASVEVRVVLWNVRTRTEIAVIEFLEAGLPRLSFSPDGRVLMLAASGPLRLWNVRARTELGEPFTPPGQSVGEIVMSLDGSLAASAGGRHVTLWDDLLWDPDLRSLADRLCPIIGRNLTASEWEQFLPGVPYQRTCSEWPSKPSGEYV
jgi:WD40 repeat protein